MLAHRKTIIAATATKVAVHVPCVDKALKLMEMPNIPDAEAKMVTRLYRQSWSAVSSTRSVRHHFTSLTQRKADPKQLSSEASKQDTACIVNTVYLAVVKLQCPNNIVRPSGDASNDEQTYEAGDESQSVERRWDREDAQSDLGLHHECRSA